MKFKGNIVYLVLKIILKFIKIPENYFNTHSCRTYWQ